MKNIIEPNSKSNKIFMFFGNLITVITGIIAFMSWTLKKFFKIDDIPPFILGVLTYIVPFCIVFFFFGLFVFFIRMIYVALKTNAKAMRTQRELMEFIHLNLIHRIRNDIIELEPLSLKVTQFIKNKNNDAIYECYHGELKKLQERLQVYIDVLSNFLSDYRQDTISVCIKVFKSRDRNRNIILNEEIISLVRSSNTKGERDNDKITIIGNNTDFTNLCKGQIVFFGSANLIKLKEAGQYINDSQNWNDEKKYASTLVTPIRYYNNDNQNNIRADVIGFLCIDSMKEILEWEKPDSFELQLLAVFSDILYVYIKDFYSCFENVEISLE